MISAFKKLFGSTPQPQPAVLEVYTDWRKTNPAEADVLAAERPRFRHVRCHVHDTPLVTTVGYRSRLEGFPSGEFMDAAAHHPFCLDVGERLEFYAAGIPTRLVFCPACEDGMRAALR